MVAPNGTPARALSRDMNEIEPPGAPAAMRDNSSSPPRTAAPTVWFRPAWTDRISGPKGTPVWKSRLPPA